MFVNPNKKIHRIWFYIDFWCSRSLLTQEKDEVFREKSGVGGLGPSKAPLFQPFSPVVLRSSIDANALDFVKTSSFKNHVWFKEDDSRRAARWAHSEGPRHQGSCFALIHDLFPCRFLVSSHSCKILHIKKGLKADLIKRLEAANSGSDAAGGKKEEEEDEEEEEEVKPKAKGGRTSILSS